MSNKDPDMANQSHKTNTKQENVYNLWQKLVEQDQTALLTYFPKWD